MKVTLIRTDSVSRKDIKHPLHICPPFTLKYIQACLQRASGYSVELIDLSVEQVSLKTISDHLSFNPSEVVVIFSETFGSAASLNLASQIKRINNPYIIGIGPDVSCRPEEYVFTNSPFDIAISGEACEKVILAIEQINSGKTILLNSRDSGNGRQNIIRELDNLPFPNYSLAELKKYPFIYPLRLNKKIISGYIVTKRGCNH